MAPSLEPRCFPHIIEQILQEFDYKTLLKVRRVSLYMCAAANKVLAGDNITIKPWRGSRPCFEGPSGALPFFYTQNRLPMQKAVMRHVKSLTIAAGVQRSARLNSLLRHLPPICHVQIHHSHGDQAFHLPDIASLTLLIATGHCDCSSRWASPLQHGARQVTIVVNHDLPQKCQLIRSVLNPAIEHLEIRSTRYSTLRDGTFLAKVCSPRRPHNRDLKILLHLRCPSGSRWKTWYPTPYRGLTWDLDLITYSALCFEINTSQVSYMSSTVGKHDH